MRGFLSIVAAYAVMIPFRGEIGGSKSRKQADGNTLHNSSLPSATDWIDAEIVNPMADLAPKTVSVDYLDDACIGCPVQKSGDCFRCAYFLESIGKLIAAPVPEEHLAPVKVPLINRASPTLLPALKPNDAATAFIKHLRDTGRHGQYQVGPLREVYYQFCLETGRRTTAENHLRSAMLKIEGVTKEKLWHKTGNIRRRDVFWIIQPEKAEKPLETKPETVAETVVPGRFPHLKDKIPTLPSRRLPMLERAA